MEIKGAEPLWILAKQSDKYFLHDTSNINNPIICFQAVLIACAITICIIKEKKGRDSEFIFKKYFSHKIADYIKNTKGLESYDNENCQEISESRLDIFVELLSSEASPSHIQGLANNLYLNDEANENLSPLENLKNFKHFSIYLSGYKSMILENFTI